MKLFLLLISLFFPLLFFCKPYLPQDILNATRQQYPKEEPLRVSFLRAKGKRCKREQEIAQLRESAAHCMALLAVASHTGNAGAFFDSLES